MTRNEVLYSLNKPDDYRLAIVEFPDDGTHRVHYLRRPFRREPDFGAASVNYSFKDPWPAPTALLSTTPASGSAFVLLTADETARTMPLLYKQAKEEVEDS